MRITKVIASVTEDCSGTVSHAMIFFDGSHKQLNRDDQNNDRNAKPGAIFHSAVTERVFLIRFLFRKFKAEKRDYRTARVGKVIDTVRND